MKTDGFSRAEGVILKVVPFRDADQIVMLFTREAGIIKLITFGGTNQKQKAKCSPLSHVEVIYKEQKSEIFQCREMTHLNSYPQLRAQLRFLQAGCDLLNQIVRQEVGKPAPPLYDLLKYFLEKIPEAQDPDLLSLCFRVKLLKYEGLWGSQVCSICSTQLKEIYAEQGHFFCKEHASDQVCVLDEDEWYLCCYLAELGRFKEISALVIPELSKQRLSHFLFSYFM